MARTTHVKRAQQRYRTIPVIDPETGQPKKTPVMKKVKDYDTGEITLVQKTTKKGKPVFMTVTERDLENPLPLLTCDAPGCGKPIEIGTPYKHITPKSGPYGGRQRSRHESCPGWQVWDYSNSLSAQLARIAHDFTDAINQADGPDDVQSALDDAAESIKEIAEQKREGASNIESGFGHPTEKSEELEQMADDLEQWADDVSSADIPELPDPEERYFIEGPDGTRHGDDDGYETEDDARDALTGMIDDLIEDDSDVTEDDYQFVTDTLDEPSEDQIAEWRDEVSDSVTIVDESPV
jgi:hypothetical protein